MSEAGEDPEKTNKKLPGKKADKATIAQRIEEVLRLRLDGAEYSDIVQYAAEKGWCLRERQVREYIGRADDMLVERQEKNRRRTVARHVAQRQALFARCIKSGDLRTALATLTDLAKLRGLYATGNDVRELAKLAATQGMQIEELTRRLHAAGIDTPETPPASPPTPRTGTGDASKASGSSGSISD